MRKTIPLLLALVSALLFEQSVLAQLTTTGQGPVVYGHHHINASDIAAHKRFWIEGLGGNVATIGTADREIFSFPNVLVFVTERAPSGGSRGTVLNHVGFETPDIFTAVAHLQAMGYAMITREELPDSYDVVDGIGQRQGGNTIAYILGPDDIKVELIENKNIDHDIVLHHVHWAAMDGKAMQAWYVEHFGAVLGSRIGQPAADLPGINLTFAPTPTAVLPSQGSVLDHIGFEVENLEAFCRKLEASGITLDRDYTEVPSLGIAIAFLTDPWGTYIELTEGLGNI